MKCAFLEKQLFEGWPRWWDYSYTSAFHKLLLWPCQHCLRKMPPTFSGNRFREYCLCYRLLTIRVSTVKTTTRTCKAFDSLKTIASIFVDTTKCSFLLILCIPPPTSTAYSSQMVVHSFGRQMIFNQTLCSWRCNHGGRQSNRFLVCLNRGLIMPCADPLIRYIHGWH